ncbi:MAG: hypothetical protein RL497_1473 [Pseudomonadota bacterium]|jgi:hypothetical protein
MQAQFTPHVKDDLTQELGLPPLMNPGLECPSAALLEELFGRPRADFSAQCRPPTLEGFKKQLKTASVGPFSVMGLGRAVDSLAAVMSEIKRSEPLVYQHIGTAGMLCCRYMRNAGQKLSSHSWGTAIDLTLCGKLDVRGNRKVFAGLTLIAPIFNRHGWYWGAKFRTEDAMHFEVGKAKLLEWFPRPLTQSSPISTDTMAGVSATAKNKTNLKLGDQGEDVKAVQKLLMMKWYQIKVDGVFGSQTEQTIKKFQMKSGLTADGIVGHKTLEKLRA